MMIDRRFLLLGAGASLALAGCGRNQEETRYVPAPGKAGRLIAAARRQIGVTTSWDGGYTELPFLGGDVPRAKGSCTNVIVRAYRDAFGADLQALVNADMRQAFAAYPHSWGSAGRIPISTIAASPTSAPGSPVTAPLCPSRRAPRAGSRATSSRRWSRIGAPISAWGRTGAEPMAG